MNKPIDSAYLKQQLKNFESIILAKKYGLIFQYKTMPTPTADLIGRYIQYTGETTLDYISGYFYQCVSTDGSYSWTAVTQSVSEYAITKAKTADSGFAATYELKKDGATVGDKINIPKDYIDDSVVSENEAWSSKKVNDKFTMFPFKWKLIGTSTPETGDTSNNTFKQTMSSGNPFCVYHSSGIFCFGNGVPANRGKLYGMTTGAVASVTFTSAGLLTVEVGSGIAYIYEMETIS